jgi:glucosyl-3-phosphoglycerate synthase
MISTFKYQEYLPVSKTAALKKKSGLRISVVIPALNEEATIKTIVASIREIMDSTKLIDEIIVMDCNSKDETIKVAQKAGANVYKIASVIPELAIIGKGVALWKSQFVVTGDILIFIDSDILDFDERFIVGLSGALLANPDLELVKASYRRPLIFGGQRIDDFGGRVTELLVRPLLNLFLPELSEMHQPLAGEYAVRKQALSQMHFCSGYGVELGLLLEYYFTKGYRSLGQVDMGSRSHRNRSLPELSKMAFEIEHVFFDYLEQKKCCTIQIPRNTTLSFWDAGIWQKYNLQNIMLMPKEQTRNRETYDT